jgi:hypothetical protein
LRTSEGPTKAGRRRLLHAAFLVGLVGWTDLGWRLPLRAYVSCTAECAHTASRGVLTVTLVDVY